MNPVLEAIRLHVQATPGNEDITQALADLAASIAEGLENHDHTMDEVVGLPEALDDIRADNVSSVDGIPDTLVRRMPDGAIENDVIRVGELQGLDGTDTIFVGGPIDMQGKDILNSNMPLQYEHLQSSPETDWLIVHGFNRYPSAITVYNSAGKVIVGSQSNIDVNTSLVKFSAGFSGVAKVVG